MFRTSCVFGGKEKDRLPGINIGTQSILTGLAGISLLPFLVFFFRFLAQMKIYIGKRILFLLSKSIYEGRHAIG